MGLAEEAGQAVGFDIELRKKIEILKRLPVFRTRRCK
jgi:hypothetical protein